MNRLQVSPTNTGNSDNSQSNGMRRYLQLMGVIESKAAILQVSILLCCHGPFGDSLLNEVFGGLSLKCKFLQNEMVIVLCFTSKCLSEKETKLELTLCGECFCKRIELWILGSSQNKQF
jgi:hypothetical protein